MKIEQSLNYLHYVRSKVVKKWPQRSGFQNYRGQVCAKLFQDEYLYWGDKQKNKNLS